MMEDKYLILAEASCLIKLADLGKLDAIKAYGRQMLVPDVVCMHLLRKSVKNEGAKAAVSWLKEHDGIESKIVVSNLLDERLKDLPLVNLGINAAVGICFGVAGKIEGDVSVLCSDPHKMIKRSLTGGCQRFLTVESFLQEIEYFAMLARHKEVLTDCYFEAPFGWYGIVDEALSKIEDAMRAHSGSSFQATQIKSKFGGLRLYGRFGAGSNEDFKETVFKIISQVEKKSFEHCEQCGEPAETKSLGGWVTSLCPKHFEEHELNK